MKSGFVPGGCWVVGLAALLLATSGLAAQAPAAGRIQGRVIESPSGRGLPGAQVVVQGTRLGATSGLDGAYVIEGVPAGSRSLQVSKLGYAGKTVTGVAVTAGKTSEQTLAISAQAVALSGVTVVSSARERGSVSQALNTQRTSLGVVNSTTAEQIARSPDADAAQAVRRVSGVTVQDGKYVSVRGLGERYTTASLNGARMPSPEPEKKVVPLDLFPSSLLESITTSKTFTPDQPGDFSGAQVNLRTKTFPTHRQTTFSFSTGTSGAAMERGLPAAPSTGLEWLGMGAGARRLPGSVAAVKDFSRLGPTETNGLVRDFRNDWSAGQATGLPNGSAGLTTGGQTKVWSRRLGYIGSLSYSRSSEAHVGETRSRAVAGDAAGTPVPYNTFVGSTGQSSILWGGLLNLSTYLGTNHKLELNNTYNRTADNEAHQDWGTLEEFAQVDSVRRTSLRYIERSVLSSQLRGEHQLGLANKVDWSMTGSRVSRREPDRSDLAYGYEIAPTGERLPLAWLGFIPEAAKRTFGDLSEQAWEGAANYSRSFGLGDAEGSLKLGTALRMVSRDATSETYNLRAVGLTPAERALAPEQIFHGAFTDGASSKIALEPNSSGGDYSARDRVGAGYAMVDLPLASWGRLVGGARLENWKLRLISEPTGRGAIRTDRVNTDVLPSLALNLKLTGAQNLRFAATQTLARPEYREVSPISYRDMLGEREVFGDSSLVRTLVQNYDARWEWYPSSGEVLSFAVFGKRFRHPIEPIDVATSGASQLSFANADGARNYGLEVEVQKRLGFLASRLDPLSLFANTTVMRSRIRTGGSRLSALTNDDRPMAGQAPYAVNAGLTYSGSDPRTSATLLYNVVGPRIVSAAVMPVREDTYDRARSALDLSLRFPLWSGMSGKADVKNLLNSAYEQRQGEVVRQRYTVGQVLSFGVSWAP